MAYVTHKRAEHDYQLLKNHLQGAADRAAAFAIPFEASLHAKRTGLLHDIGKYSIAAQERQIDPEHVARVDHSTAGAQEAFGRLRDLHAAFAIAGHHGGLPNAGSKASADDGSLMARQKKPLIGRDDASAWQNEVHIQREMLIPLWLKSVPGSAQGFANAMYTRMLFSCLVDADYLDTEAFMSYGEVQRGMAVPIDVLLGKLRSFIAPWLAGSTNELNHMRSELLRQCLKGDEQPRGLYTLTIPTGGGKTVSSLAFALSHAAKHHMSRIIYVIPYTSIIEQNAQVFRDILGEEAVLEHHSNAEFGDEENSRARLATENWDAPVIVTTAVQFFESLFSAKTSRCRKLHNIANSVIIFDEAQMLPVPFLRPCVNAIVELVQHYRVTAVLCTATQPSLTGLIRSYAPDMACREIAKDTDELFRFFRRVRMTREGSMDDEKLADMLAAQQQVLCIVNSRRKAKELFQRLEPYGCFHLSTLMTPDHRSSILSEIRNRLQAGDPCRVIATSLVEAGVDVDFPAVWREEAGLDSILQAAGRCNREGKRSPEESVVHIFCFDKKPPKMFAQNIFAMKKALDQIQDPSSPQAIAAYFHHLLFALGDQALDAEQIIEKSNRMAFRDIDEAFRLIDHQTIPVYIPTHENGAYLQALREGRPTRTILRALGRSAVNVYPQHFQALRSVLECPMGDGFGILMDLQQYDKACGLALEPEMGDIWFA